MKDETKDYICKVRLIDGVVAQSEPIEELIRCKECKNSGYVEVDASCAIPRQGLICEVWDSWIDDNDFCSRAEKRESKYD